MRLNNKDRINGARVVNGYQFIYTCNECDHYYRAYLSGEEVSTGLTDVRCPECGYVEWLSEEDIDFIQEEANSE